MIKIKNPSIYATKIFNQAKHSKSIKFINHTNLTFQIHCKIKNKN